MQISVQAAPRRRTLVWAYAALLGTFLLMAIGLVVWGPRLLTIGLGVPFYFFALVPLGLGAAGFLHGALGAVKAQYEGTLWFGTVRLGGPVAVFALVVGAGLWTFWKMPVLPPFSVAVRVQGPNGAGDLVTEGRVILDLGLSRQIQSVGPQGEVTFSEIPAAFDGRDATITYVRPGFQLKGEERRTLARNQAIVLEVTRLPVTSRLRGTVVGEDRQPVPDAAVRVEHGLASATTDVDGVFFVDLPLPEGATVEITVSRAGHVVFRDNLTTPGPHTLRISR